jgi:hypothetical protein
MLGASSIRIRVTGRGIAKVPGRKEEDWSLKLRSIQYTYY